MEKIKRSCCVPGCDNKSAKLIAKLFESVHGKNCGTQEPHFGNQLMRYFSSRGPRFGNQFLVRLVNKYMLERNIYQF